VAGAESRPTLRRRAFVLATVGVCGLWPALARASGSRVFGKYRYAGGQKQRERFERDVEDVVSQLNLLIRSIARKKISESQAPAGHVEIEHAQGMVVVRRDGAPEIRGRADGKPFVWKNRYGDELDVRIALTANVLSLRFRDSQSDTTTTYTADDDGQRMVMRTNITDPRLPAPLRFRFAYKRATAAG
jgi:hypothetical protein